VTKTGDCRSFSFKSLQLRLLTSVIYIYYINVTFDFIGGHSLIWVEVYIMAIKNAVYTGGSQQMLRKIIPIFVLTFIFLCFPSFGESAPKPIEIYINDQKVESDVAPIIENDRTMVPLRVISENLGASVYWDNAQRTVRITNSSKTILLKINDKEAIINDQAVPLDSPAIIVNDRTMVPLRFIGESLGAEVFWDNDQRRVSITRGQPKIVDFSYEVVDGRQSILIKGDSPLEYAMEPSAAKNQIAMDINAQLGTEKNALYIYDGFMEKALMGSIQQDPPVTRVVVDLKGEIPYEIKQSEDKNTIIVSPVNALSGVVVDVEDQQTTVNLTTTQPSKINYFFLSNPDRLVVDIDDTVLSALQPEVPKNNYIEQIRLGQFSVNPDTVRVVFDLKSDINYQVLQNENDISVVFSDKNKSSLAGRTIVVDPGHGGSDPGASAGNAQEKNLTLDIALKLKDVLEQAGAKVLMTRDKDISVNLYTRAGIANEVNADVFISVHINASDTSASASGTETLYYPDPEKKALAQAVQKALVKSTGLTDRGIVERPGLVVTRETLMPSALAEVAFITNSNDRSLLLTDEFQQKAAEGIANGIIDYLTGKAN